MIHDIYIYICHNYKTFIFLLGQRSRAALQRYLFYCNRYMNHMQSLRFEHKLYAQVKQKMEEMQQHNMSWIEVQFLKKAVDVLCQCRATLMYTYVFAFYLKKNNQSIIFEVGLVPGWGKGQFFINPFYIKKKVGKNMRNLFVILNCIRFKWFSQLVNC